MDEFMKNIAIAAEHAMPDNRGSKRQRDCGPEMQRLIKTRKDITMRGNDDNIKRNSQLNKKTDEPAPRNPLKDLKETNWILQSIPKRDTRLNTRRCETSMDV